MFWLVIIMSLLTFIYIGLWLFNPGCPKYQWKPHLNKELFLGRWYEMYRPINQKFETGECVVQEYFPDEFSPYYYKIRNSQQLPDGSREFLRGRVQ